MPTVEHHYRPRGVLASFFRMTDPEVLLSGPAGTGKTRALLERLLVCALMYPGMRGLIVRKTATSLTNTALDIWRKHVAKVHIEHGVCHWYGGSGQEPAGYRFQNGSVINITGMDKSERIMSSEYDLIVVVESIELTITDWEAISSRLRNGVMPFQAIWGDCNPTFPHHWLYKRCTDGTTKLIESRHSDNPRIYDDNGELTEYGVTYMARLNALTGVRRSRLRDGLWVTAEGLVYDEWDPAVHVVDRFEVPWDWARYWTIDFGFSNPMTVQFWAQDPDGRLIMYREIYETHRLVEDVAREVMDIVAPDKRWKEPRPRAIFADHDAEGRATFVRHTGLGTSAAVKKIRDGIQAVKARLQDPGDGRPRLTIMRDSLVRLDQTLLDAGKPTCLADEKLGYVWPTPKGERPPDEVPVKEDDHGCDAERYLVMGVDRRVVMGRSRVPGSG